MVEMELLTASAGNYPRIGDAPEQQELRRAYAEHERGDLSDAKLEKVYREATREVIEEQASAGLDLVTDGQLRWYDQLSHLARGLKGCKVDGLLRFFDTNFYFRQPLVVSAVKWKRPIIREEFEFAKGEASVPVKPVLTGPYTLAKYSVDRHYDDLPALALDYARALSNEVRELGKAGAEVIQVDEPAILQNPDELGILEEVIPVLVKRKGGARVALYTYFGDVAPIYEWLTKLPVDALGLDFTYSPKLPELIARVGCELDLGLGLIDGRNTRLEDERVVLRALKKILPKVGCERVYLNPSCGLDYLPRDVAFRKLQRVVEIAEHAEEELK